MELDQYNGLLSELQSEELTHDRKAEILLALREDYQGVTESSEETAKTIEQIQKENKELLLSNSRYWRQLSEQQAKREENIEEENIPVSLDDLLA